jgi:O-antigen/teichoic acid export membrane protein
MRRPGPNMSSLQRFLSASAASWARILLTVATQVLLVPLFLSHWSVEEYGCWLIIQTIMGLGSLVSTGVQTYAGYEFLKIGDRQSDSSRRLFYSALPWLLAVSTIELTVLGGLIYFGLVRKVSDASDSLDPGLMHQADISLLLYSICWLIASSAGGLAGRAVAPYGYFPRMTWWAVFLALIQALASAVAVACGANLVQTVLAINAATIIANVPIHLDMWRIFREQNLRPVKPDWTFGLHVVRNSLALFFGNVLDLSRQQGVRIFLGALLGVTQMTEFSTTRTLSNLSMQGIGTVTNPIMPELMRFLRARDAQRTEASIGFVWLFAVVLLAPILVGFQWVMPAVYTAWTRGKITYDPALFALFSAALLLFALARPPLAVLQGNNLLKIQLAISTVVTVIAVGGIFLITPHLGTRGAALSLLVAELTGTVLAVIYAARWLGRTGMGYPWTLFLISLLSMFMADVAIALMVWLPQWRLEVLLVSLVLSALIVTLFVKKCPPVAVARMGRLLPRLRLLKT